MNFDTIFLQTFCPCCICSELFWFDYDEQMDSWLGNRKRIIVLNREDMISTEDRNAWANYYSKQGNKVVFSNGQLGMVLEAASLNL